MEKQPEHIFDEWLVLKYQSGDKEAMSLLVKRWHRKIVRQVCRHTKDAEASKDIAQECWLAIIRGINKIKDPSRFGVWAMKIASHKAINWIRNHQNQRKREAGRMDFSTQSSVTGTNPNEKTIVALRKAMKKLPDGQQHVLGLFYLENYSIREISEILSTPTGTVKSRLFHSREHLKKIINHEK